MRVAFVILDGFPARHVGPEVTPVLCALAAEGGAHGLGRAVMTSATYPNHATFATGVTPLEHGLLGNWIAPGGRARPSASVGLAASTSTIFDACATTGLRAAAVVGDQHLVPVMGLDRAAWHWPPNGELPDECTLDAHGYPLNPEVLARLDGVLSADLAVVHLNEPDTAGHVHGPDSAAALDVYRATDRDLGVVLAALRPHWDDTVVIVVSDHDMQTVDPARPIDLWAAAERHGLKLIPIPEGDGSVVWGDDPTDGAWLADVDGVLCHELLAPGARLVCAEPHRVFAMPPGFLPSTEPGHHGGAQTRDQVVAVGGGASAVATLAAAVEAAPYIDAAAWAPTIAALLGVSLPSASGVALV